MYRGATAVCLALVLTAGCAQPSKPQPQIVVNTLENNTFQFQCDNGQPLDMGVFMSYLDEWLKSHPQYTVKSLVPQMTTEQSKDGNTKSTVYGVLVFVQVDPTRATPDQPRPEAKK
jgi:hypothetical protein